MLNIILIGIMVVITFLLLKLVRMVNREVPRFVDQAHETTTRVQGTVDFLGATVVKPSIEAASFLAKARTFLAVSAGGRSRRDDL